MSVSYNDKSLASLRNLVTVMDREFATTPPSVELRAAWAQMVGVLALGPAPDMRECPHCKEMGMRAASRCSRCWSSLVPASD